jgi:hypothetical protein
MNDDVDSERLLMASLARRRIAFWIACAVGLTAATGAGWYQFLRRPSPDTVCAHLDELLDQPEAHLLLTWLDVPNLYGEAAPAASSWREHCVWYYATRRDNMSYWKYAERARCAMGITEPAGIIRCEN